MVVEGDGMLYVGIGFLITVIPLLIIGMVARWRHKLNYYTLMGLIAGSNTDPPALAYANQISGNDAWLCDIHCISVDGVFSGAFYRHRWILSWRRIILFIRY